jgi:hypothetical protein
MAKDPYTTKSGEVFDRGKGWAFGAGTKGDFYHTVSKKLPDGTVKEYKVYVPKHDMGSLDYHEMKALVKDTVEKGRPLTKEEVHEITGSGQNAHNKWTYYHWLLDKNADVLGFDSYAYIKYKAGENGEIDFERFKEDLSAGTVNEPIPTIDPQEDASNYYYRDIYSLDEGTLGKEMYDRLAEAYLNQAQAQATMADVQYQNQAIQQAQIVKNITDQIRAERMARLRAGMNEAQIANQDMQMMMANINALNQNAQMMNQQRLDAYFNTLTARDQAYQAYLDQANARGQIASAFYAADSGNAYWNALQYMRMVPGSTYEQALRATQAMYDDDDKKKKT